MLRAEQATNVPPFPRFLRAGLAANLLMAHTFEKLSTQARYTIDVINRLPAQD